MRNWLGWGSSRTLWLVVPSTAIILILLVSSLPPAASWIDNASVSPDSSGPSIPTGTQSAFYPYLENASVFPGPNFLNGTPNTISESPKLVSVVSSNTPAFLLTSVELSTKNSSGALYFQEGTYSPYTALAALPRGSSTHLPLNWTAPSRVSAWVSGPGSDALASNSAGSLVYAAVGSTSAGSSSTYVYVAQNLVWASTPIATVQGTDPELSYGGGAALLLTFSSGVEYATTIYAPASNPVTSKTVQLATGVVSAAGGWLPSSGFGEEAVAYSTSAGSLQLRTSLDGGNQYSAAATIGAYNISTNHSAVNSVGESRIFNPGGVPGQVALASDGASLLIVYTTVVDGTVMAATLSSGDGGNHWQGPYVTPESWGAISDPAVTASSTGYFYVVWHENLQSQWYVGETVFSATGLPLMAPQPLSGQTQTAFIGNGSLAVSVDPYQRPMYFWWANDSSRQSVLWYTGDFVGPYKALQLVQGALNNIVSCDAKVCALSGTNGTLAGNTGIPGKRISWATANVTAYLNNPSQNATDLCHIQTILANQIYPNVTHMPLVSPSSGSVCGSLAYGELVTNSTTATGAPKLPVNYYWSPSI